MEQRKVLYCPMFDMERMRQRYREGDLPWDDPLPPPEVLDMADRLSPGRLLDLGCGGGRASIYYAQRGWHSTGIDVVPEAIDLARERAEEAGVAARIQFHVADVSKLDFLNGPFDLALDVGCMHALDGEALQDYAEGVARLVPPNGRYLLFGRVRDEETPADKPGHAEETVRGLFSATFVIDGVRHGITRTSDQAFKSVWYWMTRKG